MNTLDIVARELGGDRKKARDLLEAIRDSMRAEMERTLDDREGEYISNYDVDDIDCDCELPEEKDILKALKTSETSKTLSEGALEEIVESIDKYFDAHTSDFLKGVYDYVRCNCHSPRIDTIRAAFDAAVAP